MCVCVREREFVGMISVGRSIVARPVCVGVCGCVWVCQCVCVRLREREKKSARERKS